jgi:hypothetical protein
MDGDVPYLKEATMTDEPLTIGTYPWRTIDANELLHRVAKAEKRVAELEASSGELARASTEFADEVLEAVDGLAVEVDYNDQCDLVFGRISRLILEEPEARNAEDIGELVELGLDVTGLGVSGAQVEMALDKARHLCEMQEELAAVDGTLTKAGIEPRSTVEAVRGGDIVDRVERLVASRGRAIEQWAAANEGAKTDKPAEAFASHPHDADTVE